MTDTNVIPKVAYSYLRLSTKEQIKGYGATRQYEATEAACEKYGWKLSNTRFQDLGRSAFSGSHLKGDFGILLDSVRDGRIAAGSILILENVDRMSRQNPQESVYMMLDLIRSGISIYTIHDDRLHTGDSSDSFMNLMVWAMAAERAHNESKVKSERVAQAKAKRREEARKYGVGIVGRPPSWLRRVTPAVGGQPYYILDPVRSQVVAKVFELRLKGYGLAAIVNELDRLKLKPFGNYKKGKPTHDRSTIRKWLSATNTYGQYQPHIRVNGKKVPEGDPIENFYPPVVTYDDFVKVQETFSGRNRGKAAEDGENVLRGLLRCACGGSLSLHINSSNCSNKRYRYLRCNRDGLDSCNCVRFNFDRISTMVINTMVNIHWDEVTAIGAGVSATQLVVLNERIDTLKATIADVDKRLDVLARNMEVRVGDKRLEANYDNLTAQFNSLEVELKTYEVERNSLSINSDIKKDNVVNTVALFESLDNPNKTPEEKREINYQINTVLRRELDYILVTMGEIGRSVWEAYTHEGILLYRMRINRDFTKATIEGDYCGLVEIQVPKVDARKDNRVIRKK